MGAQNVTNSIIRATAHSFNSFRDEKAITFTSYILSSHNRVMPKLDSQDKWPNIDGFLEVQDDAGELIGKLEAQVKTLPPKHNLKYPCPVSLLAYAEDVAISPVLLLLVDNITKKIYWLHLSKHFVKNLDHKKNKETKTINIIESQYFSERTRRYIDDWIGIILYYKTVFSEYEENKDKYDLLLNLPNEAIGQTNDDIVQIHQFLDEINYLLDHDFNIVKKIWYPNHWKIGIAIYDSKPSSISFALYPIPFNRNDAQIKYVNNALHKIQSNYYSVHTKINPILENPREHAYKLIYDRIKKILEYRILDHAVDSNLATEFIFSFVDKFHRQMGLETKDTYNIEEISFAFYKFLPLWVEEAVNFIVEKKRNGMERISDCLSRNRYGIKMPFFDPNSLAINIIRDEHDFVVQRVRERLQSGYTAGKFYPIGNNEFGFNIFVESLTFIKSKGIEVVKRLYKSKDWERLMTHEGWIYNIWSSRDLQYNLELFWNNVIIAYDEIVKLNFNNIARELSFYREANKFFVWHSTKESYTNFGDVPTYGMCFLKGSGPKVIRILSEEKGQELAEAIENQLQRGIVQFEGVNYELYKGTYIVHSCLRFIYDDYPMLDFIYSLLKDRLKEYFEKQFR